MLDIIKYQNTGEVFMLALMLYKQRRLLMLSI